VLNFEIDNSALSRRVVQAVCDLAHRPLAGLRVLDLACAHGHYAFEMAKLGAQVLGIEGRETWLEQARRTKQDASLPNVEFVQDDVRNLSKEKYGAFDIVLCLGILYHLDAPDVFDFVNRVFDVCRDFAIIETHFAATPALMHEWRGKRYWGMSTHEHAVGATPEDKLKDVGASLDNERSFWFTQASLCNILRHVGFSSVYDCRIPLANLYVGAEREFKIWGNRITLAAIKGQPLNLYRGPGTPAEREADWPENLQDCLFERYLSEREARPSTEVAEDRCSPEFVIDEVGRYMLEAGITEHDHESIREAAQDVARMIGVVSRKRPPAEVSFGGGPQGVPPVAEVEPAETTGHGGGISLSPAVAIGAGWYGLEQATDDGRSFRWTSARSCLRVALDSGVLAEDANLVLHLGSAAGHAHRQVAVTGPRGTVRQTIRSGWDYYAFPLRQIVGESREPSAIISIEVSEPVHAPGDSRVLGVMVDQIMLEDEGQNFPFMLVDGLVASVKKYEVNGTEMKICDYAQSTARDILVAELQSDHYQLGAIDFRPGDIVIDIGGHIGIFSIFLAKKYPFLTILAFEPIPVSYRMFRKNLELNETRNIRLYNLAVTSDRRELDMVVHRQGNTGGATASLRDLDERATFRCSSLTLDDIFQSYLIDSCKLLRIDCEGSEHEILLTARCLDRIQYLRGDFHINQHLRRQGYSMERLAQHCRKFIEPDRIVFTPCETCET